MVAVNRRFVMAGMGSVAVAGAGGSWFAGGARGDDLATDMEIVRRVMALHPGAYRYLNPAALDHGLDELGSAYAAAGSLDGQYLALSLFLATLQCGHSYCNFFNQSEGVRTQLFDRKTRLPFLFRWIGDEMVVTGDGGGGADGVPAGSVVVSINGVAPGDMLAALLPYTRADGAAPGKRRALLEVQHRSRIEYFDVFHGLVFGEPDGGVHRVEVRLPGGDERAFLLEAIGLGERQAARAAAQGEGDRTSPLWRWAVDDAGVATLTMPTWAMYNSDWDWQSWLDARLDEARELTGLVIDNRQNEGGFIACGAALMSRLIDAPAALPQMRRVVRFRSFPDDLRAYARTWDPSFYTIGEGGQEVGPGWYDISGSDGGGVLEPRGAHVDVPAVLLTSATNSSAGFTFAQVAKATGRMHLIGDTTGGNRRGINGDGFFFTTLPGSGIEFDVPIVGQYPATPQPDVGVVPDEVVLDTPESLAAGRDLAMERALAWFS